MGVFSLFVRRLHPEPEPGQAAAMAAAEWHAPELGAEWRRLPGAPSAWQTSGVGPRFRVVEHVRARRP